MDLKTKEPKGQPLYAMRERLQRQWREMFDGGVGGKGRNVKLEEVLGCR